MYAFEKAMMDDPMLSDAVDGYRDSGTAAHQQLHTIAQELKITPAKIARGSFKQWMSIAAALIILLSGSVVLYRIFNEKETVSVVQDKDVDKDTSMAGATVVDSGTMAIQETNPPVRPPASEPKPVIIPPVSEFKENKSSVATNNIIVSPPVSTMPPDPKSPPVTAKDNAVTRQENSSRVSASNEGYSRLNRFDGKIVDENNNPLPFANITEKNSGVGTYADVNGNFVLLSADTVLNVQTRSMGYVSSSSQLRSNAQSKIVLRDEPALANAPSAGVLYERNKNRVIRSQSDTTADELEAEPYDGWNNYNVYVNNNMRNPLDALDKKNPAKAEVLLSFDVNTDGSLTNIKVERSNCSTCNNEAIRLLKEGPKWISKPGQRKRSKFTVRF